MVTGYKPGNADSAGDAGQLTTGLLTISCSYKTDANETFRYMVGTCFVLDAWPGLVLTARHVVVLPEAISPSRMTVLIGDGTSSIPALGVAYPVEEGADVAVLLLRGAAPKLIALAQQFPLDGVQTTGFAGGYPVNEPKAQWVQSRLVCNGATVRELDKPSVVGMSGGPVCLKEGEQVFAIQSRNDHGQSFATLIDFGILNDCALKARSYAT